MLLKLFATLIFWAMAYLWFFKSIHFVDFLVRKSPALGIPAYLLLALPPAFCLRYRPFRASILMTVTGLARFTSSPVLKHLLVCAAEPMNRAIELSLAFFASNLFLNAFPDTMPLIQVPKHFEFLGRHLDANKDKFLTALEVQVGFQIFSSRSSSYCPEIQP